MQGHVRRRGKKWAIVIELDRDPAAGRRRQKWVSGFATERDAQREERVRLSALDRGDDPFPTEVTVGEWIGTWLDHLRSSGRVRPRTIKNYEQLCRDHVTPRIGKLSMRKAKAAHVQSVLDAMTAAGKSPRTVEHARAALSGCFQHALAMDILASNVVRATKAPRKSPKTLRTPTGAELAAIARAAQGTTWEIPMLLATTTGARRSEVLGLRWGSVDLDGRRALIVESVQRVGGALVRTAPKTARGLRAVPLLPQVVERLRAHRVAQAERLLALGIRQDDETPVCDRGDGTPCDPSSFTHAARRIAEQTGVEGVRLHDMRHGVATVLAAQGLAPEVTSAMLGHATVGFTLTTYTHVRDDRLDEALVRLSDGLGAG